MSMTLENSGVASNEYRAALYDEVWRTSNGLGFANVTAALTTLGTLLSGEKNLLTPYGYAVTYKGDFKSLELGGARAALPEGWHQFPLFKYPITLLSQPILRSAETAILEIAAACGCDTAAESGAEARLITFAKQILRRAPARTALTDDILAKLSEQHLKGPITPAKVAAFANDIIAYSSLSSQDDVDATPPRHSPPGKDEEILALHRQLAAAQLDARNGWSRYEEANRDRNSLRASMVTLSGTKTRTGNEMEQPGIKTDPALCNCRKCIVERGDMVGDLPRLSAEMILCSSCGNKRCPHAYDHCHVCTNSNAVGQIGAA